MSRLVVTCVLAACILTASVLLVRSVSATATAPRVSAVGGVTLIGQLYRVGTRGETYPAQGLRVRVVHLQYGPSSFSYSDGAGAFMLHGIPPGDYVLEVYSTPQVPQRIAITVPAQEYVRVPAIRVP